MDTDSFIDEVMEDFLEISSSDGTYTSQRTRVLRATQRAVEQLWNYDSWDFKKKIGASATLTQGTYSVATPARFHQVGDNGVVWLGEEYEISRADPLWVHRIRRSNGTATGKPQFYCIDGQDSTTLRPLIVFDITADANYTINLDHERTRPTLVDSSSAGNGLEEVPDEHARSVLRPMVEELLASASGDGRITTELGPRARALLADMKSKRNQQKPDESRLGDLGLNRWRMW